MTKTTHADGTTITTLSTTESMIAVAAFAPKIIGTTGFSAKSHTCGANGWTSTPSGTRHCNTCFKAG